MCDGMGLGIVTTKLGRMIGEELTGEYEGLTTFRSVPYAEPPVGYLRFKPPVDHAPWKEVRDTRGFAARPYQNAGSGPTFEPWATDFYFDGYPAMSEDCLYLHITTGAQSPDEKRPVLMWFHGGGLSTGYYSEHEFDQNTLAKKGVVVVSVGQRLNVFGYLCLPQLSEEQGGRSGNYGLLDEVMALNWVRENIAAFGGDPDRITVAGQSGGTAKSTALTISPLSQGKIKRCINQSNLNWGGRRYISVKEAEESGRLYLKNAGLDPDMSVEELRKLPAERFYDCPELPFETPGGVPGSMVYDGYSIEFASSVDNMEKYGMNIDYLSGGNLGEMSLHENPRENKEVFNTADEFYTRMQGILGEDYNDEEFRSLWPVTDENAEFRSRELASYGFAGGMLGGGVIKNRYFGAYRKAKGSEAKTYAYTFGHFTPCLPEEVGTYRDTANLLAWHSSELWYTFGSLRKGMPPARPWTDLDFELADKISSYWANFIATGNPNGEGLPYWPESDANYGWAFLGDEIAGHEGLTELDELALKVLLKSGQVPEI